MAAKRNYRQIASGGHIKAKRIYGCECCNFSELSNDSNKNLKTGGKCPRCANASLRLFDSKAEFVRAMELMALRDKGEIDDLEFQPKFPLSVNGGHYLYDFVADFSYTEDDEYIVEDVKGGSRGKAIITDVAKMKIKHFELEYGIPVRITIR